MFSEWLVENGYVESVDTIESELSLQMYNNLYRRYCRLIKNKK